ncbi:MAG: diguanylate cyclase domain-containing protein [Thermotogota bacterium]
MNNKENQTNFSNKKYNLIIIIIIAITLIANYYSYYLLSQKSKEKNQESYLTHQKLQTTTIIKSMDRTLEDLKNHLESLKKLHGRIFTEKDKNIYSEIFTSLLQSHTELISLEYYTSEMDLLYDYKKENSDTENIKYVNQEWINSYLPIMEKNHRDSYIPMIHSDKNGQYMGIILPFKTEEKLQSFILVTSDLNSLVREFVELVDIPESSEIFVVDRYGSTIYSNDPSDYGKTIFEIKRKLSGLLEIYNQFISTKEGHDEYKIDKDGEEIDYLIAWDSFTIDSRKLILTISTPKEYINQRLKVVSEDIILVNIIVTLLILLFIYLFYRLKNRNLIQLKNYFENIANQKSEEYYESQKQLTEKNLSLQEAYEKLENTNTKLLDKKWALEQSFTKNQVLTTRLENIIKLISSIDITATKSLEQFLADLFDTALKVIPEADYGSVFIYKKDEILYLKTKGHDINFLNRTRIPSEAFTQFERTQSVIVEHIEKVDLPGMTEDQIERFRKGSKPMKQSITFNLTLDDKKVAGISLDIAEDSDKSFDENTKQIMEAFRKISNIFLKIQNYQMELTRKATYDSLTNTYNRRVILEILGQNINIAKREKSPLSVCFIDVDKLKYINDHLGHKIGDKLLLNVTKIIKNNIREIDNIARIGGDEFLIVFPKCDKQNAEEIWQRILNDFEKFNQENDVYSIEVSHGIAEYNEEHIKNVDELITEADEKMYEEKNEKRRKENDKS